MNRFQGTCRVAAMERPGPGIRLLEVEAPEVAGQVRPGQFVMLRCGTGHDPLLRRPLSVHGVRGGRIALLFRKAGRGTALLAALAPGGRVDLLGPLGRGFSLRRQGPVCLVGGGMGIAPLHLLARGLELEPGRDHVILGAAGAAELAPLARNFPAPEGCLAPCTDDGGMGRHGLVTDLLAEVVEDMGQVYACGPWPMMAAVAAMCARAGVACEVSLEARMACGLGACLGCAVRRRAGGCLHVCADGPVVDAREVAWKP